MKTWYVWAGGVVPLYSPATDRFYGAGWGICGFDCRTDLPRVFVTPGVWIEQMALHHRLSKLYCIDYDIGAGAVVDLNSCRTTAYFGHDMKRFGASSCCVDEDCDRLYLICENRPVLVYDCVGDTLVTALTLPPDSFGWTSCAATNVGRLAASSPRQVALLDCATGAVTAQFNLPGAQGLISDPAGRWVYAVADQSLVRIDPLEGRAVSRARIGVSFPYVCFAPSLGRIYCADEGTCKVYVLTSESDATLAEIPLPGQPTGMVLDSVGRRLYVSCERDSAIWVVDCEADTLAGTVGRADGAESALAFYPDGRWLYAIRNDSLDVLSCGLGRHVDRIGLHDLHLRMAVACPEARAICASEYGERRVAVIDADRSDGYGGSVTAVEPVDLGLATVVRGALFLDGAVASALYDISGSRVAGLHAGRNDVSGLPPGVYYIRESSAVRKVIIAR